VTDPARFRRAIAAIDAANADDPTRIRIRGALRAKELAHAELVSEWVAKLAPGASEALRLAARAHHVRRWEIARASFPADRAGYHRWRVALQAHHARIAGELLAGAGYTPEEIARVQDLVRKRGLGRDPEVQALEDALCLVFLETQLSELADRMEPDRIVPVLRKSLRKMSPEAIALAGGLPLAPRERELLGRAVAEERAGAPIP
jgi:hypothetical protein